MSSSPTNALNALIRASRSPTDEGEECQKLGEALAKVRSFRLPIVLAQWIIRQKEDQEATVASRYLEDWPNWLFRLEKMDRIGIGEEHLQHWSWILHAESDDDMLARFVSSDVRKPVFLLLLVLGSDKKLHDPATLGSLLLYIEKCYIKERLPRESGRRPAWLIRRQLWENWDALVDVDNFHLVLQRLVFHSLRVWPEALVSISDLVIKYMRDMLANMRYPEQQARYRNMTYNLALNLFRRPAGLAPVENMKHNWKAQKNLLSFASTTNPALLLSDTGLRAVRRVMLSLEKTSTEARNTARAARTWPPFREVWDGMDERLKPDDYFSRSVKAGQEMTQAGYLSGEQDKAMGALGGAMEGQFPSIQTRSLAPKSWKGRLQSLNVFSTWAARVKATRNAQEAWMMLQSPPSSRLKPNCQVYAEMFEKLYAPKVSLEVSESQVPGDGKEVWDIPNDKLTTFEKIRLQPPSAEELYERMLRDGNRPVGFCLQVLIRNAGSVDNAMRYLEDGPHRRHARALLDDPLRKPSVDSIKQLPLSITHAWTKLLCDLHSNDVTSVRRHGHLAYKTYIERAIDLTFAILPHGSRLSGQYKPFFYTILRSLATSKTLFSCEGPDYNGAETMRTFLTVFSRATESTGFDVSLANGFARMQQRFLRRFIRNKLSRSASPIYVDLAMTAHQGLIGTFAQLTQGVPQKADSGVTLPGLYYDVTPTLLLTYIRAFGSIGDWEKVCWVTDWILDSWNNDLVLGEAKLKDKTEWKQMGRIFGYIQGMSKHGIIPEREICRIDARLRLLEPRTFRLHGIDVSDRWDWPETLVDEGLILTDAEVARRWIIWCEEAESHAAE